MSRLVVTGETSASHLTAFMQRHAGRIIVLTGAGCSTESGIPDYRSPNGLYKRPGFKPLTADVFFRSEAEQQRYWGRSMLGYSSLSGKSCNPTHLALQSLCERGTVEHLVTQNVDGLHHLAAHGGQLLDPSAFPDVLTSSSAPLTELHGNIHLVSCSACRQVSRRADFQRRLVAANSCLIEEVKAEKAKLDMDVGMRPDGDFELNPELAKRVKLAACDMCGGGPMRPHVVMFGENVPAARVNFVSELVTGASCLVCLGTSLQVFSAFRFVKLANEAKVPIAIANKGLTRGDELADLKIECDSIAHVLSMVESSLIGK